MIKAVIGPTTNVAHDERRDHVGFLCVVDVDRGRRLELSNSIIVSPPRTGYAAELRINPCTDGDWCVLELYGNKRWPLKGRTLLADVATFVVKEANDGA